MVHFKCDRKISPTHSVYVAKNFVTHAQSSNVKEFYIDFLQTNRHPLSRSFKSLQKLLWEMANYEEFKKFGYINSKESEYSSRDSLFIGFEVIPPLISPEECIQRKISYLGTIQIYFSPDFNKITHISNRLEKFCDHFSSQLDKMILLQKHPDIQYTWDGKVSPLGWESEEKQKHVKFIASSEREFKTHYATFIQIRDSMRPNEGLVHDTERSQYLMDNLEHGYSQVNAQNMQHFFLNYVVSDDMGIPQSEYIKRKSLPELHIRWNIIKKSPIISCSELYVPFMTNRGTFILENGREVRVEKTIGFANGLEVKSNKSKHSGLDYEPLQNHVANHRYGLTSENKISISYGIAVQKLIDLHRSFLQDTNCIGRLNSLREENVLKNGDVVTHIPFMPYPILMPFFDKEGFFNTSYSFKQILHTNAWLYKCQSGSDRAKPFGFSVIQDVYKISPYHDSEVIAKMLGETSLQKKPENKKMFQVCQDILQDCTNNVQNCYYLINLRLVLVRTEMNLRLNMGNHTKNDVIILEKICSLILFFIEDLNYLLHLLLKDPIKSSGDGDAPKSSIAHTLFMEENTKVFLNNIEKYSKECSSKQKISLKAKTYELLKYLFLDRMNQKEWLFVDHVHFVSSYWNLISLLLLKNKHLGHKYDPVKKIITENAISDDGLTSSILLQVANISCLVFGLHISFVEKYLDPFKLIAGLMSLKDFQFSFEFDNRKFLPLHSNEDKLYNAPASIHLRSRYEGTIQVICLPTNQKNVSSCPENQDYIKTDFYPNSPFWYMRLSLNSELSAVDFNTNSENNSHSSWKWDNHILQSPESLQNQDLSTYLPKHRVVSFAHSIKGPYKKISTKSLLYRNLIGFQLVNIEQKNVSFDQLPKSIYADICSRISHTLGIQFTNSNEISSHCINPYQVLTEKDIFNLEKVAVELYNDKVIPLNLSICFIFSRKWCDTFNYTSRTICESYLRTIFKDFASSLPKNVFMTQWKQESQLEIDGELVERYIKHFHSMEWICIQMLSEISSRLVIERELLRFAGELFLETKDKKPILDTIISNKMNTIRAYCANIFQFPHIFKKSEFSLDISPNKNIHNLMPTVARFPSYDLDPELQQPFSNFVKGHVSLLRNFLIYGLHLHNVWGNSLRSLLFFQFIKKSGSSKVPLNRAHAISKTFSTKITNFISIENDLDLLSRCIVRSNMTLQERIQASHYLANKTVHSIGSIINQIATSSFIERRFKLFVHHPKFEKIIAYTVESSFELFQKLFKNINILESKQRSVEKNLMNNNLNEPIDKFRLVPKNKKLFLSYIDSMSNRNRWSVLNSLSKVTFGGMRGIQVKETIKMEDRDVYPSYFGRLCLVRSPEGSNVGIINYTTVYSRINSMGLLEIPYRVIKEEKITNNIIYISLLEEKHHYICFSSELFAKDGSFISSYILARKNGKYIQCHKSQITLCELGSSYILSPAAALIPFVEANDTARVLMGGNMQTQAIEVSRPQRPLVSSGLEPLLTAMVANYGQLSIDLSIKSRQICGNNCASYFSTEGNVWNGLKKIIDELNYIDNFPTNFKNSIPNLSSTSNVGFQQPFRGEAMLGQNVFVGYVSANGNTFEDSILVSDELVQNKVFHHGYVKTYSNNTEDTYSTHIQVRRYLKNARKLSLWDKKFASSLYDIICDNASIWSENIVHVGENVIPGQQIYHNKMRICLRASFRERFSQLYLDLYNKYNQSKDEESLLLLEKDISTVCNFLWYNLDEKVHNNLFGSDKFMFKEYFVRSPRKSPILNSIIKNGQEKKDSSLSVSEITYDILLPTFYTKPLIIYTQYYNEERNGNVTLVKRSKSSEDIHCIKQIKFSLKLFHSSMMQNSLFISNGVVNDLCAKPTEDGKVTYFYEYFLDNKSMLFQQAEIELKSAHLLHDVFLYLLKSDSFYYSLVAKLHIFLVSLGSLSWNLNKKGGPTFLSAHTDTKLVLKLLVEYGSNIKTLLRDVLKEVYDLHCTKSVSNLMHISDTIEKINAFEFSVLFNSIFDLWYSEYTSDINLVVQDIITKLVGTPFDPNEKSYFFTEKVLERLHTFTSKGLQKLGDNYSTNVSNYHAIAEASFGQRYHSIFKENTDWKEIHEHQRLLSALIKNYDLLQSKKHPKMAIKKLKQLIYCKLLSISSCTNYCEIIEIINSVLGQQHFCSDYFDPLKIEIYEQESLQPGDKLTGRYGNKGVISRIVSKYDMPYMPCGRPLQIALNPLGVTSRMNLGQLIEVQMGLVGGMSSSVMITNNIISGCHLNMIQVGNMSCDKNIIHHLYAMSSYDKFSKVMEFESGIRVQMPSYKSVPYAKVLKQKSFIHNISNQFKSSLISPTTGLKLLQSCTVGYMYMFKLEHLATKKVSVRSGIGRNKMSTGQPVAGKKHHGGQKYGEMEMSCFLAYGTNYLLGELLGVKSGSSNIMQSLGKNYNNFRPLEIGQASSTFHQFESELDVLGSNYEITWSELKDS